MPAHVAERKAGQLAAERYDLRYRAWLRRVWWALPLLALPLVAIFVMFGLLHRQHMEFFWGLGFGAGFAFAVAPAQSPPAHIERWRQGAEGERATARALRPLAKSGWVLISDVQRDHVLIGPAGVFVRPRTSAAASRWRRTSSVCATASTPTTDTCSTG